MSRQQAVQGVASLTKITYVNLIGRGTSFGQGVNCHFPAGHAIGCYRYAFHPHIATSNPPDCN